MEDIGQLLNETKFYIGSDNTVVGVTNDPVVGLTSLLKHEYFLQGYDVDDIECYYEALDLLEE